MVKSMTGFGRAEVTDGTRKFTVEMKSVNHRYLDVNIKMPKKLNFFESAIRNVLKEYVKRGKVDIFISYEEQGEETFSLKYNKEAAAAYLKYMNQMEEEFGIQNDVRVSTLAKCPDVFVMEEENLDEEVLWKGLEQALREACAGHSETRTKEGENLKNDLLAKLDHMLELVAMVEERSPQILAAYKQRLYDKVREMIGENPIEDSRILTEITIFSDKICVDEEIVRLKSHVNSMKKILTDGGDIGKKLDFMAQEMNREANTTLSKANDLELSYIGVDMKTEIEKIREQIQNIE